MRLKIVPNVGYHGDDDDVLPGGSEPDVGKGLLRLEQDKDGHHQPPYHNSQVLIYIVLKKRSTLNHSFYNSTSHFFLARQIPKIEHYIFST
jgi:hypothetical protein